MKKAHQELLKSQKLSVVGAIFSHSQPGLSHLLKEGNIKQLKVIVPANIDPSAYLERTVCKELDHLPLDYPRALVQERNVFKGVSLDFYFNRKYPLVRHVFSWKDEGDENEGEKQLEVNGHTEKQQACNNGSRTEVDHGNNDIENRCAYADKTFSFSRVIHSVSCYWQNTHCSNC